MIISIAGNPCQSYRYATVWLSCHVYRRFKQTIYLIKASHRERISNVAARSPSSPSIDFLCLSLYGVLCGIMLFSIGTSTDIHGSVAGGHTTSSQSHHVSNPLLWMLNIRQPTPEEGRHELGKSLALSVTVKMATLSEDGKGTTYGFMLRRNID